MSVGLLPIPMTDVPVSFRPLGLAERPTVERLHTRAASAVGDIFSLLDDISAQAANCPTVEDFRAFRDKVFQSYIQLTFALNNVLTAKLDPSDVPSLIDDSFDSLYAHFESDAALYFGEDAYHEILFSLSTLKSAYRWLPRLATHKLEGELLQQDNELSANFGNAVTWVIFHLAGLGSALDRKQTIVPDVLQELLDGLRQSVMAYAHVRAALELRSIPNPQYAEGLEVSWDEEDEALANAN
jgi:hypothetical protein